MPTLHTVNKAPRSAPALEDCLRAASAGDVILLIEDGVYAATEASWAQRAGEQHLTLCALEADIRARGIDSRLQETVEAVDDAGFVHLSVRCAKVCSWY